MTGPRIDPIIIQQAITTPRWNILARTGLDPATIGTWDKNLNRRKRICVPVDVQAFVVTPTGGEATVGVRGDQRDAAPFTAGSVRPAGVHIHWALPDALLKGEPTTRDANGQSEGLVLSPLPDRWCVLRLLRPRGVQRSLVRGWVINALTKTTAPLETYDGTFPAAAAGDAFDRLDASVGGSLIWSASYTAAAGRFGFHDPLNDLPPAASVAPNGLHDDSAAYVVTGWWNDLASDPIGALAGLRALALRLDKLGWMLDDDALPSVTPADRARRDATNATLGLESPTEGATVEYAPTVGRSISTKVYGVAAGVSAPVKII